jgi:hypothetical protein
MADVTVKVLRQLNGGEYEPGDTREMAKGDAERLEATGAVKITGEAKAEPVPIENKMEPAPANKAATKPARKGK